MIQSSIRDRNRDRLPMVHILVVNHQALACHHLCKKAPKQKPCSFLAPVLLPDSQNHAFFPQFLTRMNHRRA
jgi:hypothetical protein